MTTLTIEFFKDRDVKKPTKTYAVESSDLLDFIEKKECDAHNTDLTLYFYLRNRTSEKPCGDYVARYQVRHGKQVLADAETPQASLRTALSSIRKQEEAKGVVAPKRKTKKEIPKTSRPAPRKKAVKA